MIWLPLHPSPASGTSAFNKNSRLQQAPRQVAPFPDQCLTERTFAAARPHDIFLYGNFLRSHDRLRRSGRAESYSKSFQLR